MPISYQDPKLKPDGTYAPPAAAPGALPNASDVEAEYWKRLGLAPGTTAKSYADDVFKDGSLGRLSDPRARENQELLDLYKSRLGGLTAQENQAAMDQGHQTVQNQMAAGLERYASIAGANGVRGGANAALQGRAINEGNQNMAAYQRQLILDNVGLKNSALDKYGGALGTQTERELGIADYNIGKGNQELYGRTSMPFDIASGIQGAEDSAWSRYFSGRGVDIAQQGVDAFKGTGGYTGKAPVSSPAPSSAVSPGLVGKTTADGSPVVAGKSYNIVKGGNDGQDLITEQPVGDPNTEAGVETESASSMAKKLGYKDMLEWGTRDPAGFARWKSDNGWTDNTGSTSAPKTPQEQLAEWIRGMNGGG